MWGIPLAFFGVSFVSYLIHRANHRFDILWRGLHQMHHSIERVDMPGWTVGHPLEAFVFTAATTVTAALVLGVEPVAITIAGIISGVMNMFEHWNVPTPRWVGYIVQRPEQHCLHHERGIHARNYSGDIALWDIIFGTFVNTPKFDGEVGFGHSSVNAIPAMLLFRDVNVVRSDRQ